MTTKGFNLNKNTKPVVDEFGREANNPYLHALRQVGRRLRWDLNWKAFHSRRSLKRIKNSYLGKKAVIVCNGPSLLKTNLESLSHVYSFGLNKINLIFDKTSFRPNSIVAINKFVLEQNQEYFRNTPIQLFLNSTFSSIFGFKPNICYLHGSAQPKFARDCSVSMLFGPTVTFTAMQLAFHMGFRSVALVGCDHNFFEKGKPNKEIVAEGPDISHFDPNYFSEGVHWQLPDLVNSESHYQMAGEVYAGFGRELINCTVGGELNILPRRTLEEWLAKGD